MRTKASVDIKAYIQERIDIDEQGCWVWRLALVGGYGHFGYRVNGRLIQEYSHRASYRGHVGEVPEGLDLDHLCRNRACCNPDHLEPVTRQENCRRGDTGNHESRKTHCPSGHEYNEENTRIYRGNQRLCRACDRARRK